MKKICVLQADYSTSNVDYKNYDPPRNLSLLLPDDQVDHVFLNKLTTYQQLKNLKKNKYDIYVNLCEGYLDWPVPSIDVIHSLEMLNLPYTGPNPRLYDPPKELMKYVACTCGVSTPAYKIIKEETPLNEVISNLSFPLFIKPAKAGDSLGIDDSSMVTNKRDLGIKISGLLKEYEEVLAEEYIPGREFTVLVANIAGAEKNCKVFNPLEFVFPEGKKFKTYSLKTSELHEECNIPCTDKELSKKLKEAALKIFKSFNGEGYARLDFRINEHNEIYFLEINFTCSVFYENGYEGSADYILNNETGGKKDFLNQIIAEGIYRHQQKQKKYFLRGNAVSGYGIYSSVDILKKEIIFKGEEKAHRLVSKKFVDQNWDEDEKENFRKYAWPVSEEVYILWDDSPSEWAPQNHSCDPNTQFDRLNVIAIRDIKMGEELTLDYTTFLNGEMESFICNCQSKNCRKIIHGASNASIYLPGKNQF